MQITKAEVAGIELRLRNPVQTACLAPLEAVHAIFVRLVSRQGQSAWGCTVAHPDLTGAQPAMVLQACQNCAAIVQDLVPTNLEYSLAQLIPLTRDVPAALVAFDLAFHDLLGKATGLPLYRILGGYRNQIPTSATVPLLPLPDGLEIAEAQARMGFRVLKVKGGVNPDEDVEKMRAIHRALPHHRLRLDADGGYSIRAALEVARALEGTIELLEQPTPPSDLAALRRVARNSPLPIFADQSVTTLDTALQAAAGRMADGFTVKVATCGGIRPASQFDAIARAARLQTMVGCLIEPRLLIAAGLAVALSTPNVQYADLDGHLDLLGDPSTGGFRLQDGTLVALEEPGLGCEVNLG
jgi:L-alanine-DL-glutamate epimerase-like enolase superfamily enzyme